MWGGDAEGSRRADAKQGLIGCLFVAAIRRVDVRASAKTILVSSLLLCIALGGGELFFLGVALFNTDPRDVVSVLCLLGIDHTRLTFRFQGRLYRLTDVHGEVVRPVLA